MNTNSYTLGQFLIACAAILLCCLFAAHLDFLFNQL